MVDTGFFLIDEIKLTVKSQRFASLGIDSLFRRYRFFQHN